MLILLLFNLIRPPILPITDTDLIKVESLTTIYQKYFDPENKIKPTKISLFRDGKYLVFGFQPNHLVETEAFIQKNYGKIVKTSKTDGNYLLAYFPDFEGVRGLNLALQAQNLPFIRYLEPALEMKKCLIPNDTFFLNYQWDKWIMYSDLIWDITLGLSDVIVAVCDQGVDYYHSDLSANFNPYFLGYDFVDLDPDPYPDSSVEMHGTHVAGIIGAVINNHIGIAGWSQVQLLAVRVLSEEGSGSDYDVAEGIRWSVNQGARIINLSLGGYEYSSVLLEAVEYAWNNGVLLFAATGNDGIGEIYYPAKFSQCIAVGALDQDNHIANFSNYGLEQELVCPGVGILSTVNDNQYAIFSGTSMASPQASGVAALILSVFPNLSNQMLRAILDVATLDLGSSGKDSRYGYGLLNAYRAYTMALHFATQEKTSKKQVAPKIILGKIKTSNKLLIYDAVGRKIDKISNKGVYFINDLKTNKKIKKIIFR